MIFRNSKLQKLLCLGKLGKLGGRGTVYVSLWQIQNAFLHNRNSVNQRAGGGSGDSKDSRCDHLC